jgi:hypothetical protein
MEAKKLIELMASSGVLSKEVLDNLIGPKALEAASFATDRLSDDKLASDLPVDENANADE